MAKYKSSYETVASECEKKLDELQKKREKKMLNGCRVLVQSQYEFATKSEQFTLELKRKLDETENADSRDEGIVKEGYLHVKTDNIVGAAWQKSWFVLKDGKLHKQKEKGKKVSTLIVVWSSNWLVRIKSMRNRLM